MTHDTQPASADEWFARGNACAERGEFENALECYEKACVQRPTDPGVYNNLGSTYVGMERFPEALQCYQQARALDPNNANLHHSFRKRLPPSPVSAAPFDNSDEGER